MNTKQAEEHRLNGRYTFSSLDRMCVCGHTLGVHTAGHRKGQAGECICHDVDGAAPGTPPCPCAKFNAARKPR